MIHAPGAILALGSALAVAPSLPPGDHLRTLRHGGVERRYLVHVPARRRDSGPWPVVLAFHGGASNAEAQARFSGLGDKADRAGFLAVYPSGSGRLDRVLTWNGGECCGLAAASDVDDVGFVRALLDDLARLVPVDRRRVFATGMSNGAILAHRLGCELADRIAAVAAVSGPIGVATCAPSRAVPVLHIHGTEDEFAPYGGGEGPKSLSGTAFRSALDTVRGWVERDGCRDKPEVVRETPRVRDGTSITRETWRGCREGAEVVLVTVVGGGHTWPGRDPRILRLGRSTRNLSANDAIWEFFSRHPLPEPADRQRDPD